MDELRLWWPLISLFLTSGIAWLVWSMKQSFATRADIEELKSKFNADLGELAKKVGAVSGRIDLVERDVAHLPTTAALQETNIRLEKLFGAIEKVNANYRHIFHDQVRLQETVDRHGDIMSDVQKMKMREQARAAAREAAQDL